MCLIVWDRKTAEREQERKTKRYKDRKAKRKINKMRKIGKNKDKLAQKGLRVDPLF